MNAATSTGAVPASAAPPEGEPLDMGLQAEIDALMGPLRDGLSEYSFASLYLFRERHGYRFQRGELPCIAGVTFDGERHLLPLFDMETVDRDALRQRLDGYDCYYPLAERRIAAIDRDDFSVAASADDADYIYQVASFLQYRGEDLGDKRGEMKQLLKHGQPVALPFGRSSVDAARAVLDASIAEGDERSAMSYEPCREAITHAGELGLQGHVYFLDEEPIGFVLGAFSVDQMMVLHFAKSRADLPGVQPMMFHHTATVVADKARWFNFEQDLGLDDFKQDKMAYQPSTLLQKYRVRPARRR